MSELEKAFRKFATYGDTAATGNDMTCKNFSKLCKDCGVMDGKAVTSTDVDIVFNKVKLVGGRLEMQLSVGVESWEIEECGCFIIFAGPSSFAGNCMSLCLAAGPRELAPSTLLNSSSP